MAEPIYIYKPDPKAAGHWPDRVKKVSTPQHPPKIVRAEGPKNDYPIPRIQGEASRTPEEQAVSMIPTLQYAPTDTDSPDKDA